MLDIIRTRLKQGHRTSSFPKTEPTLPDRFRGLPQITDNKCPPHCQECATACPTDAISPPNIDLGRCLFCTACQDACPQNAIQFTPDYRLATRTRDDLVLTTPQLSLATAFSKQILKLYGRSLRLRVVSAAGCNGCEVDVNVLTTIVFDLSRFGISIVASPRHADGLIVTGPVSKNMQEALKLTYDAIPSPKFVVAVGACAISGGPFINNPETLNGADSTVPVDLYIPGCPPHPFTILDGLLRVLGQRT